MTIDVAAVNDAPVHTVPGPQATLQNTPLVFSAATGNAIMLADADAGGGELTVTLAATNGSLTLGSVAGLSSVTGDSSASVSITGTLAALNAALDGLRFLPGAGYNGPATVTVTTSDLGNSGAGGARGDSDILAITVSPNIAPTVSTTAAPVTYVEGGLPVTLDTALTVSDPDNPTLSLARLRIQGGYVPGEDELLFANQFGLTGSWDQANGTLTLTGAASAADYQAALRAVAYVNGGQNPVGTRTVSIVVSDGAADSSAAVRTVSLAPQNDAPVLIVPGAQTVAEDSPLVFSAGTGNQIAIADVDGSAGVFQLTLGTANGTLTLLQTAGLAFMSGANGSSAMSVQGSIDDLNGALSALRFDPASDYVGLMSLLVEVDDLGNSGAGGALNDSRSIAIDVTPVNDAPVGADDTVFTDEDATYVFSLADFGFSDPNDVPSAALLAVRVTQLPGGGTLTVNGTPVVAGAFVRQRTSRRAVWCSRRSPMRTVPATPRWVSGCRMQAGRLPAALTWTRASARSRIDVNAVNDAPLIDAPGAQAAPANTPVIFSSVTATHWACTTSTRAAAGSASRSRSQAAL